MYIFPFLDFFFRVFQREIFMHIFRISLHFLVYGAFTVINVMKDEQMTTP